MPIIGNNLSRYVPFSIAGGYVVDSFDFNWRDWHWPAFNLADIAIVLDALLLVFASLLRKENPNTELDGSSRNLRGKSLENALGLTVLSAVLIRGCGHREYATIPNNSTWDWKGWCTGESPMAVRATPPVDGRKHLLSSRFGSVLRT